MDERKAIQAYADELFEFLWTNSSVFCELPKKERNNIIKQYNDLYNFFLLR
jgi:hypothetical protein